MWRGKEDRERMFTSMKKASSVGHRQTQCIKYKTQVNGK